MATKKNSTDLDFVRMYYQHQYDRIGKNEGYGLTISNYVITLSALAFTFGFQNSVQLTTINGIGLPLLIISANIFSLLYIDRSVESINIHRDRAQEILQRYAPELREIDEKHKFRTPFLHSRKKIEKGLHQLLILVALIPLAIFLYQINWK